MVDIENTENYTVQKLNLCSRKLETLPLNISRYTNLQTLQCNDNNLINLDNLPIGLEVYSR